MRLRKKKIAAVSRVVPSTESWPIVIRTDEEITLETAVMLVFSRRSITPVNF